MIHEQTEVIRDKVEIYDPAVSSFKLKTLPPEGVQRSVHFRFLDFSSLLPNKRSAHFRVRVQRKDKAKDAENNSINIIY